jgi:hypothetical protein
MAFSSHAVPPACSHVSRFTSRFDTPGCGFVGGVSPGFVGITAAGATRVGGVGTVVFHGRRRLIRFGVWATSTTPRVTNTTIVRRRRGLDMSTASHPWNWYVMAVPANTNAASSTNPSSMTGPTENSCPSSSPVIPATNSSRVRLASELR